MPFAGMAIGDGLTDPLTQLDYSDFLYETGLVGANGRKEVNELDNELKKNIESKNWEEASKVNTVVVSEHKKLRNYIVI